jgi:predicted signal transduction protein with EAL and GGDEF domain
VLAGREVAAVLEFFAATPAAPDSSLLELFTHIGVQLGRVIERERAQAQTVDAYRDSLTHLPNRAQFLRFLQRALKRQERYPKYKFAVLFIDLDGFKAVNDSMGHRSGDALLMQIGRRLARTIRVTDVISRGETSPQTGDAQHARVARLGGDEFTILLEDIQDISDAIRVADRIHMGFTSPFSIDSGEVFVSASIGIAGSRPGHASPEDILQDADIAMYRAKAAGKRRSVIFNEDMHQQAVARLQLETDLRRAVARREFFLEYQPVIDLASGRIRGVEALLRWRHPVRGVVSPSMFIPVAEDDGTILEIGAWALVAACRQLRVWQDRFSQPALSVAVNLSAKQFGQTDLPGHIREVLQMTGVRPESLSLELTETIAMATAANSQRMEQLRHLGVEITIDDFGTGYSSLSRLAQFRVNTLKIDRSFVRQLGTEGGLTLVRAMLSLAQSLGLAAVAEGVETAEEAESLRRLGCAYAQGFYFHRPMDADGIERLLSNLR